MLFEDEWGTINLVVPPPVYERHRLIVRTEPFVLAAGRLERRGGTINVVVETLRAIERPDLPRATVKQIEPPVGRETGGRRNCGRGGSGGCRPARRHARSRTASAAAVASSRRRARASAARSVSRRAVAISPADRGPTTAAQDRGVPAASVDQHAADGGARRKPRHQRGQWPGQRLRLGAGRRALARKLVSRGDDRSDQTPAGIRSTAITGIDGASSGGTNASGSSRVSRWCTTASGERRGRMP